MKHLATIVALLVTIQLQPSVHLSATWLRPGVAQLTWVQPNDTNRACLTRIPATGVPVALDCYDTIPHGAHVVITLGATKNTDASYRPQAGDTYAITINGIVYTAPLRGLVRLPVILG